MAAPLIALPRARQRRLSARRSMILPASPDARVAAPTAAEMPTPSPALSSPAMRRNYRLGVANGVLFALGGSLSSANLGMALLLRQLGGSPSRVGRPPPRTAGLFLLP